MSKGKIVSNEIREIVDGLRALGLSNAKIGRTLGVADVTIATWIKSGYSMQKSTVERVMGMYKVYTASIDGKDTKLEVPAATSEKLALMYGTDKIEAKYIQAKFQIESKKQLLEDRKQAIEAEIEGLQDAINEINNVLTSIDAAQQQLARVHELSCKADNNEFVLEAVHAQWQIGKGGTQ